MRDEEYWSFGRKEICCVSGGTVLLAVMSLWWKVAPPWWFLPMRGSQHLDRWSIYADKGGYSHFWMQSLIGWFIVGGVLGLIFSNVILRGKSWDG